MAKITRYNGNLVPFASASLGTERTIFGGEVQANDITSQFTPDFLRGWGIVGPSDHPELQDFNAVSYTHGQILSYLHQMGVPEYNAAQEYHVGSVTTIGVNLYVSLTNNNTGNNPSSSPTNWKGFGTAAFANLTTSATDVTAGRVLKVGDLGLPSVAGYLALPKPTAEDSLTDLNTITEAGWWGKLLGGAPGSRPANFPTGQTGDVNFVYLLVMHYGNNRTQIAYSFSSGPSPISRQWMRNGDAGTWSGWVEFATTGAIAGADKLNTTRIGVASSATVNLTSSAPNTRHINITGTTGITAFTVAAGQCYFVRFNASLTLTNSANIVTQSGANITTAAGDTCIIRATAENVVEVICYVRAAALPVIIAREERATGVAGPNSVAGVQVRQLNTVATNTIAGASLGSNQLTLPAGTYDIEASAPFYGGDRHRAYLYNVTDASNAILGTSENSGAALTTRTFVTGRITITSPKVFELRHYTQQIATYGMGDPAVDGFTEVYAELKAGRVG